LTTSLADNLRRRFQALDHLQFREWGRHFTVAEVSNGQAAATIALQGAQLIDYRPHGQESVVWLSERADLTSGRAVRGGIPVCWPWFGAHPTDPKLPSHGFARTAQWSLEKAESVSEDLTLLQFELTSWPAFTPMWPHRARVRLTFEIGSTLKLELVTRNEGDAPFTLNQALHTYFRVSDISAATVHGLEGRAYLDKLEGLHQKQQLGPVTIDREVDRVYLGTGPFCELRDEKENRRIRINTEGSHTTVVWNPWKTSSARLGDMTSDGFRHMLCVEAANTAGDAVDLSPRETHRMIAEYAMSPL
jgi:D-hexose-6-phosphate mutarotase